MEKKKEKKVHAVFVTVQSFLQISKGQMDKIKYLVKK